ncbi:MAG: heme exporter protein CcmD [Burkholderiaceae bacterium]|nr:heme exporter protein CcmD [Burkholderiaceae bacterium]
MPDWLAPLFNIHWADWPAFWAMGRHGAYVWPAVALSAVLLLAERWQLSRQIRAQGQAGEERS